MENILVSACLLGARCRYDGQEKKNKDIQQLIHKYNLIPFCPEIYGGLQTPREPAEQSNGRVLNKAGVDVTEQYERGAKEALRIAKLFDCKYAILKKNSPSCGSGQIYDGTFSGTLVPGDGVTAKLFKDNGIIVMDETAIKI